MSFLIILFACLSSLYLWLSLYFFMCSLMSMVWYFGWEILSSCKNLWTLVFATSSILFTNWIVSRCYFIILLICLVSSLWEYPLKEFLSEETLSLVILSFYWRSRRNLTCSDFSSSSFRSDSLERAPLFLSSMRSKNPFFYFSCFTRIFSN